MIYFDYNATAPLAESVKSFLNAREFEPFNPSSIHTFGRNARKSLEEARSKLLTLLCGQMRDEYKLIFTSGATEANNTILQNFKNGILLYAETEHASVYEMASSMPFSQKLRLGSEGIVDFEYLEQCLAEHSGKKILVSIMSANNETGVLQPLAEISSIVHNYGAYLHSDIVQSFGKTYINLGDLNLDFASISGHKLGALHGIGCIIAKRNFQLEPLLVGGGQEKSERSGTENLLGAESLAIAASAACSMIDEFKEHTLAIKNHIEAEIEATGLGIIACRNSERLPNTSLIISKVLSSELQLIKFDLEGIMVSNGSACSSGKVDKSRVLRAMNVEEQYLANGIRVSLGASSSMDEGRKFIQIWKKIHQLDI